MAPRGESKIERKPLTYKSSLNEISPRANTSANAFPALKNRGFDSRREAAARSRPRKWIVKSRLPSISPRFSGIECDLFFRPASDAEICEAEPRE
jgi:hypothetical protein